MSDACFLVAVASAPAPAALLPSVAFSFRALLASEGRPDSIPASRTLQTKVAPKIKHKPNAYARKQHRRLVRDCDLCTREMVLIRQLPASIVLVAGPSIIASPQTPPLYVYLSPARDVPTPSGSISHSAVPQCMAYGANETASNKAAPVSTPLTSIGISSGIKHQFRLRLYFISVFFSSFIRSPSTCCCSQPTKRHLRCAFSSHHSLHRIAVCYGEQRSARISRTDHCILQAECNRLW